MPSESLFSFLILFMLYVGVLSEYMFVYHMYDYRQKEVLDPLRCDLQKAVS